MGAGSKDLLRSEAGPSASLRHTRGLRPFLSQVDVCCFGCAEEEQIALGLRFAETPIEMTLGWSAKTATAPKKRVMVPKMRTVKRCTFGGVSDPENLFV